MKSFAKKVLVVNGQPVRVVSTYALDMGELAMIFIMNAVEEFKRFPNFIVDPMENHGEPIINSTTGLIHTTNGRMAMFLQSAGCTLQKQRVRLTVPTDPSMVSPGKIIGDSYFLGFPFFLSRPNAPVIVARLFFLFFLDFSLFFIY